MITETLTIKRVCKNSVRFDNKESESLKSIYIMNEAVLKLNNPKKIKVTIENIDE